MMLERFGAPRYLREIGARPVDQSDWGKLYRVPRPGDTDMVLVEVINSTPEPDGSCKPYMLRCHPELRPVGKGGAVGDRQEDSALNAVASSFGMRGGEYARIAGQS